MLEARGLGFSSGAHRRRSLEHLSSSLEPTAFLLRLREVNTEEREISIRSLFKVVFGLRGGLARYMWSDEAGLIFGLLG